MRVILFIFSIILIVLVLSHTRLIADDDLYPAMSMQSGIESEIEIAPASEKITKRFSGKGDKCICNEYRDGVCLDGICN